MLNLHRSPQPNLWSTIQAALHGGLTPTVPWQDHMLKDLRRGYTAVQEAYVAQFLPLVDKESRHYGRLGQDINELSGEGALALWEAAFSYRPGQHRTPFSTYVKNHIHQRVRRAYHRQRRHCEVVDLIPLNAQRCRFEDESFSFVEWTLDLTAALNQLGDADRHVLRQRVLSPNHPQYEKYRKRLQRARRRLKAQIQGGPGKKETIL